MTTIDLNTRRGRPTAKAPRLTFPEDLRRAAYICAALNEPDISLRLWEMARAADAGEW